MKNIDIIIYKMTGRQLFFNVPEKVCEECDLTVAMVKNVAKRMKDIKINIEVKQWFNNLLPVILKGGWHPPVVLVNGKIFSQGIVPDAEKLESKIKQDAKNL